MNMDPAWAIAAATLLAGWLLQRQNKKHHKEALGVLREQKTVYILDAQMRASERKGTLLEEPASFELPDEPEEGQIALLPQVTISDDFPRLIVGEDDLSGYRRRRHMAAVELRVWIKKNLDSHQGDNWGEMRPLIRQKLNSIIHEPFKFGSEMVGIAALSREHLSGASQIDMSLILGSLYKAAGAIMANTGSQDADD